MPMDYGTAVKKVNGRKGIIVVTQETFFLSNLL